MLIDPSTNEKVSDPGFNLEYFKYIRFPKIISVKKRFKKKGGGGNSVGRPFF